MGDREPAPQPPEVGQICVQAVPRPHTFYKREAFFLSPGWLALWAQNKYHATASPPAPTNYNDRQIPLHVSLASLHVLTASFPPSRRTSPHHANAQQDLGPTPTYGSLDWLVSILAPLTRVIPADESGYPDAPEVVGTYHLPRLHFSHPSLPHKALTAVFARLFAHHGNLGHYGAVLLVVEVVCTRPV